MFDFSQLSERQVQIYEFVRSKVESRGYGPTVREIGTAFDIKSPNGVMCHLKALEKKGLILREGFSARAAQLVDHRPPGDDLPLLGRVAAGAPEISEPQVDLFAEEATSLRREVITLRDKVDLLERDAEVREDYLRQVRDQIRCPGCERKRDDWY